MGDQGQELPWSELRLVGVLAGFGSLGGFVSWIYAVTIGEPLPLDMPGAIAASVAVGAFAGVIGVLLLANIDSTKAFTRTVAIALVFGFFWKPTIEASKALIDQRKRERVEKQARALAAEADRAMAALSGTPKGPELRSNIGVATERFAQALAAAQRVENRNAQDALTRDLELAAIRAVAKLDDPEAAGRFHAALAEVSRPQLLTFWLSDPDFAATPTRIEAYGERKTAHRQHIQENIQIQ